MLPLNFHNSFIPERRFIGQLLEYVGATSGTESSYQDIASETGIPVGSSTGKVPAIVAYASGMGLLTVSEGTAKSKKQFALTSLGRMVYLEDRYLGERAVQWLAHMNLCRSDIGAIAWNEVFVGGRRVLGDVFTTEQIENYLVGFHGPGRRRTGPMILTYLEDAAFGRAGILSVDKETIVRRKAPPMRSYAIAYSAHVLSLMEAFFPGRVQVTMDEFALKTGWFDVCLWDPSETEHMLSLMESKGYLSVDRQMLPWLIERRASAAEVWPHIWADMA